MKRFLILNLVLCALAAVPAMAGGEMTSYGDGVTISEPVAIDTLLANPDQYVGQKVRVDGVITGVQRGYVETEGATIVDLKNSFVLPGLMDMHVHLQGQLGPDNDRDTLKLSPQLMQMRSAHYAMNTLMAGFTTVRDVGSSEQEMYALRDAINEGWIDGPRIIAAGGVGITGGHADISGVSPDLMKHWTSANVCDGPYDCRRAARNVIKYGGDLIKITSTGGVMTQRATGTGQQMETDELQEVVRAGAPMGGKVASPPHQVNGIVSAREAGVASNAPRT